MKPTDNWQRLLEFSCGLLPFLILAVVIMASIFWPNLAAVLILVYTAGWMVRLLGYSYRLSRSYYVYKLASLINWRVKLHELDEPVNEATGGFWLSRAERWYAHLLLKGLPVAARLEPDEIYQAVIIAVFTEPEALIEATVQAVLGSDYDLTKVILIIAYEARGDLATQEASEALVKRYGDGLKMAKAIKHPANLAGEVAAKAGNITYGAKWLSRYCRRQNIPASKVMVTTIDADNQLDRQYLAGLAWTYAITPRREHRSYQPLPLITNHIWQAPALVRLVASDTSFWFMMESIRPRRLRLFSAYAQSLKMLEEVDYWNVATVVEDGHQFWRSYFKYRGDHAVAPIWLPVYQDVVLAGSYWQSLSVQFSQLLRWAWGVSDTPFVIRQSIKNKEISKLNKVIHIYRQLDDYIAWATAPIILSIGGWLPLIVQSKLSYAWAIRTLPYVVGATQLLALIFLAIAVRVYFALLPPRPPRYSIFRNLIMGLQWTLEPLALIIFFSLASLNANARLVLGKPLEKFNATIKTAKDL